MSLPLFVPIHSSVFSPLVVKVFGLVSSAFAYLPCSKLFFAVEGNFVRVQIRPWGWRLIPWCLVLLVTLAELLSVWIVTTTTMFNRKFQAEIQFFNTVIISVIGWLGFIELSSYYFLTKNSDFVNAVNYFFLFENRSVEALTRPEESRKRFDAIGAFFVVILPILSGVPLATALFAIHSNLDPIYYIFKAILSYLGEEFKMLEGVTIAVRMILAFLFVAEYMRFSVTFFGILIVLVAGAFMSADRFGNVQGKRCLRLYLHFRLSFTHISHLFEEAAVVIVMFGQCSTIAFIWLIVSTWRHFHFLIIVCLCAGVIVVIIVTLFLLNPAIRIRTETLKVVQRETNFYYCSTGNTMSIKRYGHKVWKSQQSVQIKCGPFFVFKRGATVTYFKELIDNLVNAIILIKPDLYGLINNHVH